MDLQMAGPDERILAAAYSELLAGLMGVLQSGATVAERDRARDLLQLECSAVTPIPFTELLIQVLCKCWLLKPS